MTRQRDDGTDDETHGFRGGFINYAALRCTVEPKFAERAIVKHTEYLKKAKLVQSSAQSVSDSEVVAVSGDRIPYDFLVVSTGSTYTGPATKAERIKEFEAGG
jgi:NADH dehydrogenase FAD-containing subunit